MVVFLVSRFEVGLQTGKRLLSSICVAGFDGASEALIIRVCLRIFAKWRGGGT